MLLDGGASRLVEDVEPQVETAQQFEKPLVHERFRHDDEHALRATGEQQPVEDQAGLDRLAEADFVGKEHAGNQAPGHLRGDAELVGQQIDASAEQTRGRPTAACGADA